MLFSALDNDLQDVETTASKLCALGPSSVLRLRWGYSTGKGKRGGIGLLINVLCSYFLAVEISLACCGHFEFKRTRATLAG